jgi:hypothetical protein
MPSDLEDAIDSYFETKRCIAKAEEVAARVARSRRHDSEIWRLISEIDRKEWMGLSCEKDLEELNRL